MVIEMRKCSLFATDITKKNSHFISYIDYLYIFWSKKRKKKRVRRFWLYYSKKSVAYKLQPMNISCTFHLPENVVN